VEGADLKKDLGKKIKVVKSLEEVYEELEKKTGDTCEDLNDAFKVSAITFAIVYDLLVESFINILGCSILGKCDLYASVGGVK
jgi:hypothetical protein